MTNMSYDIYLRATPQEVHNVLTEPALLPSWLVGMQFHPDGEEDPRRLSCEWLQTERLEINGGASSVVRFDLTAMGQVTRLTVSHVGLKPEGSLLKVITSGWPMILSSLKSLMETGEPLAFIDETRQLAGGRTSRAHRSAGRAAVWAVWRSFTGPRWYRPSWSC
jgi:uncharacterized protein YndB with AHSA1/START domain